MQPKRARKKKEKIVIGRKDKADFPEFALENIDIKMDTGAYTSAIHCHKIEKTVIDNETVVVFSLLDPSHSQYNNQQYATKNFTEKWVKNSFGGSEKRFVIKTNVRLFNKKYRISLSLSQRGEMRFPILIGRKFMMGKFMVDPAQYDLSFKNKQQSQL